MSLLVFGEYECPHCQARFEWRGELVNKIPRIICKQCKADLTHLAEYPSNEHDRYTIIEIISTNTGQVLRDSDVIASRVKDSVDFLQTIAELEEQFDIKVPTEEFNSVTPDRILEIIIAKGVEQETVVLNEYRYKLYLHIGTHSSYRVKNEIAIRYVNEGWKVRQRGTEYVEAVRTLDGGKVVTERTYQVTPALLAKGVLRGIKFDEVIEDESITLIVNAYSVGRSMLKNDLAKGYYNKLKEQAGG